MREGGAAFDPGIAQVIRQQDRRRGQRHVQHPQAVQVQQGVPLRQDPDPAEEGHEQVVQRGMRHVADRSLVDRVKRQPVLLPARIIEGQGPEIRQKRRKPRHVDHIGQVVSLIRKAPEKGEAAALLQHKVKQGGAVDPQQRSAGFPGIHTMCLHSRLLLLCLFQTVSGHKVRELP